MSDDRSQCEIFAGGRRTQPRELTGRMVLSDASPSSASSSASTPSWSRGRDLDLRRRRDRKLLSGRPCLRPRRSPPREAQDARHWQRRRPKCAAGRRRRAASRSPRATPPARRWPASPPRALFAPTDRPAARSHHRPSARTAPGRFPRRCRDGRPASGISSSSCRATASGCSAPGTASCLR